MFKKFYLFVLILIAVSLVANAGDWFDVGPDARTMGMGGASVALDTGPYAVYWNPSALPEKTQIATTYAKLLGEIDYFYIGASHEFDFGRLGFGFSTMYSMGFEQATWDGTNGTLLGNSFGVANSAFSLGYSLSVKQLFQTDDLWADNIRLGSTLKMYMQNISEDASGTGFGLDFGMQYKYEDLYVLGLSVINALPPEMNWDTGAKIKLPSKLNAGVAYNVNEAVSLALDLELHEYEYGKIHLGSEWWVNQFFALRGGYDFDNLYFGLGLLYAGFNLDFAYTSPLNEPQEYLEPSSRISIGYTFEKPEKKEEEKEEKEEEKKEEEPKEEKPTVNIEDKIKQDQEKYKQQKTISVPIITVDLPDSILEVQSDKIGISGTVTNAKAFTINGDKIYVRPDTKYYVKKDLQMGVNEFSLKAYNEVGDWVELIRKVKRVAPPPPIVGKPVITVNLPEDTSTIYSDKVNVFGSVNNASKFMINDKAQYVRPDKKYFTTLQLKKGLNIISFKATNKNGDVVKIERRVNVVERPTPAPKQRRVIRSDVSVQSDVGSDREVVRLNDMSEIEKWIRENSDFPGTTIKVEGGQAVLTGETERSKVFEVNGRRVVVRIKKRLQDIE